MKAGSGDNDLIIVASTRSNTDNGDVSFQPNDDNCNVKAEESEKSECGNRIAQSDDERKITAESMQLQNTHASIEQGFTSHLLMLSAEDEDNGGARNYQIVKKSIFKPQRNGFFSRLTSGASSTSSRRKYVLNDTSGIIVGEKAQAVGPTATSSKEKENETISPAFDEVEGLQVSIDRSRTSQRDQEDYKQLVMNLEDAALGGPSEVVIHSGESELGFATLNPIINSAAPIRNGITAPAMTKSLGISIAKANPTLLEIPISDPTNVPCGLLLIINAIGAAGLPKAEKFGTQSCLLEMKLLDEASMPDNSTISLSSSPYLMRTKLHKKCGSKAQWNQQFTTTLLSKEYQSLCVEVKTGSRIVVGRAKVPLDKVGDLFCDQSYPLFRNTDSEEKGSNPTLISAGHVHLQLKVVDTLTVPMPPIAIPPLQLPLASVSDINKFNATKSIPTILLNGSLFFKMPYHTHNVVGRATEPRCQWVAVKKAYDSSHLQITWGNPTLLRSAEKKNIRSLDLALVTEIREGCLTAAFSAQTRSSVIKDQKRCFSLITGERTLDLVAASKEEAQLWVTSLRGLIYESEEADHTDLVSARTSANPKQLALPLQKHEVRHLSRKLTGGAPPTEQMLTTWKNCIFDLARQNRLDNIKECLAAGCPIDLVENGTGDTLLILACRQGNAELVELCLSRRAKNDPHPEYGETALQVAVSFSHAHCVGLLLSTAARSDMDSEIVNHVNSNNDTPLHVAGRHGDLACLELLLQHGADMSAIEEFGRTPLHCAVANGNLDCVAFLLDVGGDVVLNSGDHDSNTALHYAALLGKEAIVKLLLESAANVFAINANKESAYDVAIRERQHGCAMLISKYMLTNENGTRASVAENKSVSASPENSKLFHPTVAFHDNGKKIEKSTSQSPLSPSEQIRDVLMRKHQADACSPTASKPFYFRSPNHPVTELSSFGIYPLYNEQLIAMEQTYRERIQTLQQYSSSHNSPRHGWEHYHQVNSIPYQYEMQTRRESISQILQTDIPDIRSASLSDVRTSSTAWNHYNELRNSPHEEPQWEMFYTADGYQYYVNKITGVSQWDNPNEENACIASQEVQPDTRPVSLGSDAVIRLRLSEARKQKVLTTFASPVSSSTLAYQPGINPLSKVPLEQTPNAKPLDNENSPHVYDMEETHKRIPHQIQHAEVLTSRAMSFRGQIQLMELERSSNLALTLANFKIHDHYEQIVSDIVTMNERAVDPALLRCLQQFFPTETERKALQSFDKSVSTLSEPEQFFYLLFQVPDVQERVNMFLYKLEFTRAHSTLLSRILVVKRACRDLVENYSFIQSLEQFFKGQNTTSFSEFEKHKSRFISECLSDDEKLRSFRGDLEKAVNIEPVDLQLQLNQIVGGMQPIQAFVSKKSLLIESEERDSKVLETLQRFIANTRGPLTSVLNEYEAMEQWADKLLSLFGESKATCQIPAILRGVFELL